MRGGGRGGGGVKRANHRAHGAGSTRPQREAQACAPPTPPAPPAAQTTAALTAPALPGPAGWCRQSRGAAPAAAARCHGPLDQCPVAAAPAAGRRSPAPCAAGVTWRRGVSGVLGSYDDAALPHRRCDERLRAPRGRLCCKPPHRPRGLPLPLGIQQLQLALLRRVRPHLEGVHGLNARVHVVVVPLWRQQLLVVIQRVGAAHHQLPEAPAGHVARVPAYMRATGDECVQRGVSAVRRPRMYHAAAWLATTHAVRAAAAVAAAARLMSSER